MGRCNSNFLIKFCIFLCYLGMAYSCLAGAMGFILLILVGFSRFKLRTSSERKSLYRALMTSSDVYLFCRRQLLQIACCKMPWYYVVV